MKTSIQERPGVQTYGPGDIAHIMMHNSIDPKDFLYLSALRIPTGVIEIQGSANVAAFPTRSAKVYEIEEGDTGYWQKSNGERIILLNIHDTLDYSRVSDLHQVPDAEVYIMTTEPWESESGDFELVAEWYRDETYTSEYSMEGWKP